MSEFDCLNSIVKPDEQPAEKEEVAESDFSKAEHYDTNQDIRRGQLMERLKLKNKIIQYQDKFPDELKAYSYKMDKLDQFSNEDLQVFLDEIQIAVSQRNNVGLYKSIYFSGLKFLEKASSHMTGVNMGGLHNVLYGNPEVQKCLDEISLKYCDDLYMPAPVRLTYLSLQVCLTMYDIRKTEQVMNSEFKKPVKEELVKEYSDL
jgi:hypothetical protein